MTKYRWTPSGMQDQHTGDIEPFSYDAPVCLPQIMRGDDQEPLVSMADGKTYTSKAAMRESYKASNNPRGEHFVEIGDDAGYLNPQHKPLEADKSQIADAVIKAEAAVARGEFDHIA